LTLADVPEEIIERILALVLVQSPDLSPRPSWHLYQTPPAAHPTVISPLLVCRAWLRIGTPIHYRHPVLRTPRHVQLLLRALRHTPSLATSIRSLHVHATSPALRDLVPLCHYLNTLDITVDNADNGAVTHPPAPAGEIPRDRGVIDFCEAFTKTRSIRHLVIRKNAYLTQSNAIYIFEQLAKAVARWHKLETVNVAFRLSPSPAATALVKALAAAPRLHTLYTELPAVWNATLLDIAQNPALIRIVLTPALNDSLAHLFVAEAKKHPRLMDLFYAGSPPPPPSQHLASAHASATFRARAPSTPMPYATWGYERDVPPPVCPPVRRPSRDVQGPPGTMVGPSAFAYAQVPALAPSASSGMQYQQQQQQLYRLPPQHVLAPQQQQHYHHH
ncbi:hypothetical protein L226DRAFT_438573, partial [Lentinus tigrinus ALCF2SS1-7]